MSEDRPQYQAANKSFGDPIPTPIELAKKLRYLSNVKVTGAAPTGD